MFTECPGAKHQDRFWNLDSVGLILFMDLKGRRRQRTEEEKGTAGSTMEGGI